MKTQDILHILRNTYGHSQGQLDSVRIKAADLIEKLEKTNKELCEYAHENGLPTINLDTCEVNFPKAKP